MSSVYYPSVVVNMTLRFDEAFHVFDVASVSPDDLATKALNPVSFIQKLTPQPLLSEAGATPPGTPFGPQTENESQRLTTLLNRIPKTANIELPGYRQAGKFSLTFDYRDLPVDPRLLRSVAIHIYIGAVPAKNFSDGMVGFNSDGGRSSILTPSINNLMLAGIVDTWSVTHTGTVSEIHMEGRDHRGWLLDTVIDPTLQKSLVLTKPIDDVVRQILGKHPQGKNINVSVYPEDWGLVANPRFGFLPLPSPGDPTVQTRSRKGANGQQSKAGPPGDTNKISYWLLITQYCQLVGATPVFRNDELIIRPARALWDQQDGGLSPEFKTPFVNGEPRNVTLGEAGQQTVQPIKIRRLVYGRDISSMTFERKYTSGLPSSVLCFSVNPDKGRGSKKLVFGQWPTVVAQAQRAFQLGLITAKRFAEIQASKKGPVSPSGKQVSDDPLRIPIPGIKDATRLQEVAKAIFEEVKRGEMGGSVQTKNLASLGGDNADPDLLTLRPGDAVELLVDARSLSSNSPLVSVLNNQQRMSSAELQKEMDKRFGAGQPLSEDITRVIIASAKGNVVELQTFFRVGNVKYDWNASSGLGVAFDFQNYIEARSLTEAPSTGAPRTKTTKAST